MRKSRSFLGKKPFFLGACPWASQRGKVMFHTLTTPKAL